MKVEKRRGTFDAGPSSQWKAFCFNNSRKITMHSSRVSYIVRSILIAAVIIACHVTPNTTSGNVTLITTSSEEIISPSTQQGRTPYSLNCTDYGDGSNMARNGTQYTNSCLESDSTVTQINFPWHNKPATEITSVEEFHTSQKTFGSHTWDPLNLNHTDCINRIVQHRITVSEGSIYWSVRTNRVKELSTFCAVQLIVPETMVARVQVTKVRGPSRCGTVRFTLLDETQTVLYYDCPANLPGFFFSYSSIVFFNMTVDKSFDKTIINVDLLLNITTMAETMRPRLGAIFTSPTTGYLELINWNKEEWLPAFVKTSVRLTAPENYMVVIHLQTLDVDCEAYAGTVTLRSENNSISSRLCVLTPDNCTARVFYSGKVDATYQSWRRFSVADFKIKFYFYPISQPPVQFSADRWRCATANWGDVNPPWSCIFVFGCSSDEDGVGCWEADGNLQQGLFQLQGRCFALSKKYFDYPFSPTDEYEWCQQLGGQMISLHTKELVVSLLLLLHRLQLRLNVYFAVRGSPPSSPVMYRNSFIHPEGTVAHFTNFKPVSYSGICGTITYHFESGELFVQTFDCGDNVQFLFGQYICQTSHNLAQYRSIMPSVLQRFNKPGYIQCPENHFTHVFLACDEISDCWLNNNGATSSCAAPLKSLPLLFQCAETQQSVPYTLVCNHRADCRDGSDESFCYFPPCDDKSPFTCDIKRCVQVWERCDQQVDCDDSADEDKCISKYYQFNTEFLSTAPALIVDFVKANFNLSEYIPPTNNTSDISFCPVSHFLCVSLPKICLPVYFRCNGVYDCPGHEDEAECDSYTCPGFYRCRGSQACVHQSHLCDGSYNCPQRDDEILCNETCPQHCVCHGWAFVCSDVIRASSYPNLRYLDASDTRMTLADLDNHTYLVHLSLVGCNLTTLHEASLQNLRILDLSNNKLTRLTADHFSGLKNLQILKLSDNRLKVFSFYDYVQKSSLKTLDLSNNYITQTDLSIFSFFSDLTTLNLSGTLLNHVTGQGFPKPNDLRVIDLRFCPMTIFPREIFQELDRLQTVYADSYKLCCPATLPGGFNVFNCHAPSDEVSSCDDLLRSNLYRVGLAIFASLALAGNVSSLVYRLIFHRAPSQAGYDIFVTNLCMADLLMGVYLLIIDIADQRYRGVYLWEDVGWRNSSLCTVAGFISFLSSEVSVFIIFLITIDRFLVLRFPFQHLHFEKRSAQFACTVSWLVGLGLAVIPLLPVTSHWQFYSQTSICFPLPTSSIYFPGRGYSYGVKVILNCILFICIFIGQIFIYLSVQNNSISATSTSANSKDFIIAKRLITVAILNFVSVFPVCFMGILSFNNDVHIFVEVNIGIAIFVLPINSALNPFLYTINIYLERRRRVIEEKRRKYLVTQLKISNNIKLDENSKVKITRRDAVDFVKTLLSLSPEDLSRLTQKKARKH